jgi:peptidoglycan/xylan/chitin deacetylase (PgdA/CDA1 family)
MKLTIRKAISRTMHYLGITRLAHALGNKGVIILAYHRIVSPAPKDDYNPILASASEKDFQDQMEYLSKNYNVISLERFLKYRQERSLLPRNCAIITFDDGYKDFYKTAYPILKRFSLPATVFISTGAVEKKIVFWWDEVTHIINNTDKKSLDMKELGRYALNDEADKAIALTRVQQRLKLLDDKKKNKLIERLSIELGVSQTGKKDYLDWEDIKEMSKNQISFGAHTVNHPILTNISLDRAKQEIVESKRLLEKKLRRRVSSFAYPNGTAPDFNDDIIRIVRETGFACAVTCIPAWCSQESDAFKLGRVFVKHEDDMTLFKSKMVGMDILLGKRKNIIGLVRRSRARYSRSRASS